MRGSAAALVLAGAGLVAAGASQVLPTVFDPADPSARDAEAALAAASALDAGAASAAAIPASAAPARSGAPVRRIGQAPAGGAQAPVPAPARTEIPRRIVIPVIDLDAPIQPVDLAQHPGDSTAQWDTPAGRVAGWHRTSARLGEPGNMVLNGHHNIQGRVFARLKDVKLDDRIVVTGDRREATYTVVERLLLREAGQPLAVRAEHARYLQPTPDAQLTLVTCWPPSGNTHRLILIARPILEVGDNAQ